MILNDASTLNGIYQDIYFNGKITANTFPANDLLRIVNKYYKMAQGDIRAVNEDFFGEIYTYDLQVNTGGTYPNEYLMETSYEKIKQIQIAYNPINTSAPLNSEYIVVNLINQRQISDPSFVFNPSNPYAIIYDASFFINPLATQAVTKGIKVFAIDLQADLASATDKPNIFTDYHDVITWGSLIDVAIRKGDDKLYKKATDMFKARRTELKAYAGGRVTDFAGAYVEGQNANEGGWQYPFGINQMN